MPSPCNTGLNLFPPHDPGDTNHMVWEIWDT